MKKGGFLRNVLDTIRSNQAPAQGQHQGGGSGGGAPPGNQLGLGGQLKPAHLALWPVARHGHPEDPTALAYDPVQRIAAIGTRAGAIRIFGRPGVELWAEQAGGQPVTQLRFLVNQGALISVGADECLHLWSLRGPQLKLHLSAGSAAPTPSPASPARPELLLDGELDEPQGYDSADRDTGASQTESAGMPTTANNSSNNNHHLSAGSQQQPKRVTRVELIHTLRFQREHVTCLHQTLHSKWLYVGTERGNVHVVNIETFELSGYQIAWNKAIELSRKTHPGAIVQLAECPQDSNKLLLGYESGCIVLWDLKARTADGRYYHQDRLTGLAWHYEGKQFVASHQDGSLVTWQTRTNLRPSQAAHPHAKSGQQHQSQPEVSETPAVSRSPLTAEQYEPILKVDWRTLKTNEQCLVFSGGLPAPPVSPEARSAKTSTKLRAPTALTVMLGKSITVLEMDEPIVDFITLTEATPYENDQSEPYAIIVLLRNDLIIIDLLSAGFPSFESPYPHTQLNESPVTCVHYLADCPTDLIPLLYSTSKNFMSRAPKKGFSDKEWPIQGGEWGQSMQSYPELVLTGHQDGSVKFWDASGVNFDLITKLRTGKLLEHQAPTCKKTNMEPVLVPWGSAAGQQLLFKTTASVAGHEQPASCPQEAELHLAQLAQPHHQLALQENLFAVDKIAYFSASKRLLVAGSSSQLIQYKLSRPAAGEQPKATSGPAQELTCLLVEPAASLVGGRQHLMFSLRRAPTSPAGHTQAGFQPELVCLTPVQLLDVATMSAGQVCLQAPKVTALGLESNHNILAYAHENGVVLVDLIQKCVIMNATLSDLYGGSNNILASNRDISIQPFATSSILQHHFQASSSAAAGAPNPNIIDPVSAVSTSTSGAAGQSSVAHQLGPPSLAPQPPGAQTAPTSRTPTTATTSATTSAHKPLVSDNADDERNQQQHEQHTLPVADNQVQQQQHQSNGATDPLSGAASRSDKTTPGRSRRAQSGPVAEQPSAAQIELGDALALPVAPPRRTKKRQSMPALSGGAPTAASSSDTPPLKVKEVALDGRPPEGQGEPDDVTQSQTSARMQTKPGQQHLNHRLEWSQPAAPGHHSSVSGLLGRLFDKIDSSFTRSRSSSGSSNTQHNHLLPAGHSDHPETVQCLCFVDCQSRSRPPAGSTSNEQPSAGKPVDYSAGGAQLALWLGTSQGCVLLVCLTMPDNDDNRVLQLQAVQAEPIPHAAVKLPGSILCLATFSSEPHAMRPSALSSSSPPSSLESDPSSPSPFNRSQPGPANLASSWSLESGRAAASFLAVVSAKQAHIYHLPAHCVVTAPKPTLGHSSVGSGSSSSQEHHLAGFLPSLHHHRTDQRDHPQQPVELARLLLPAGQAKETGSGHCVAKVELSESSFSVRSELVQMRQPDESCLVSFLGTGSLVVHSLPQLRLLMEADFVACSSAKIGRSMCMSRQGHCLYQPSSSEICKFTISAQYKTLVNDMTGSLYVPKDMPEMPRTNFFKSLFGSVASTAASKQSDRDELFGECSAGKAARGVAKHIPSANSAATSGHHHQTNSPSGLDKLKAAAVGSMGAEMRMAREGLDERGEKLSEIEDRTLQMMLQSESYSQTAHQLAQKFKDKKWYQF